VGGGWEGEKKELQKAERSVITCSTSHQRWNPEYPPGKPGKPHPVGCALSGEATINNKKKKQTMVSHVPITKEEGKKKKNLRVTRRAAYLSNERGDRTDGHTIRTSLDLDRQHAGMPHQPTAAPSRWRWQTFPPSWLQTRSPGWCSSAPVPVPLPPPMAAAVGREG
jgi:hypothetical protein